MAVAAAAVMPRITMLALLTTGYNSLFGLLFVLGAWCLLVSLQALAAAKGQKAVAVAASIAETGQRHQIVEQVPLHSASTVAF